MPVRRLLTAAGYGEPAAPRMRHIFSSGAPRQRQPRTPAEARLLAEMVQGLVQQGGWREAEKQFNEDALGPVVYAVQPDEPMEELRRVVYSLLPGTFGLASSRWGWHVIQRVD